MEYSVRRKLSPKMMTKMPGTAFMYIVYAIGARKTNDGLGTETRPAGNGSPFLYVRLFCNIHFILCRTIALRREKLEPKSFAIFISCSYERWKPRKK